MKTIKSISIFTTALLISAAAAYVFSPISKSSADTVNVGVGVETVISLSLDKSSLSLSGNPGTFVSGTVTADVSTNSAFGYTLAMEDVDSNTSLTSSASEGSFTSTFVGAKTEDTIENNTWGFSIDATNFYKIPTRNNPVALKRVQSKLETDSDSTTITIGAKIGMSITSGLYQDQLLFSAYANGADGQPDMSISSETGSGSGSGDSSESNPPIDPELMQYGILQNYSCENLENTGDGVTLRDIRDNNLYNVKKLADGRCWIVQDLRIQNKTLTSNDSDLQTGQTFTLPKSETPTSNQFKPMVYNTTDLYVEGTHGYYSWYTATAGSGATATVTAGGQNAASSICPKGWRLPTGGNSGEYKALFDQYSWDYHLLADGDPYLRTDTGTYRNGTNGSRSQGIYWTSTLRDASSSYRTAYIASLLPASSTHVVADYGKEVNEGVVIRCINRNN